MRGLGRFVVRNAAWLAAVATSAVSTATAFGWHLTGEQVSAITSLVAVLFGTTIQVHANVSNGKNGHA